MTSPDNINCSKWHFLARLNNVYGQQLYCPWLRRRRRPQILKFLLKILRPHYFLTLSPIGFIFGKLIHIGPKFCAVPSPLPLVKVKVLDLNFLY